MKVYCKFLFLAFIFVSSSLMGQNEEERFIQRVDGGLRPKPTSQQWILYEWFLQDGYYKNDDLFFKREGSHAPNTTQKIPLSKKKFKTIKRSHPSAIDFDENKLTPFDNGGTCSAMALDFLTRYLTECQPTNDTEVIKQKVTNFSPYYRANNTTFVSRQAAYNTIKVVDESGVFNEDEIKQQKMQSLANYHQIELLPVTDSIKLKEVWDSIYGFCDFIDGLPEGAYLVRALYPRNNHKKEWFGHTMVLIKGEELSLYFDNAYGANDITNQVGKFVTVKMVEWGIPEFRLYHASCPENGCRNLSNEIIESFAY